jgi:predicted DNA-binding protein YlxM (UPF0122 family)
MIISEEQLFEQFKYILDPKITIEEFRKFYYDEYYSANDLARLFNVNVTTILSYMKRHNLKCRNASEAATAVAKKRWGPTYQYNPEKSANQNRRLNDKVKALNIIGGLKCTNCGCDKIRILKINHKNSGGTKERSGHFELYGSNFYRAIIIGKRKTDDLEVLCKLCNILHDIQMRFGIAGHKVTWEAPS